MTPNLIMISPSEKLTRRVNDGGNLVSAFAENHSERSHEENLEVEPEGTRSRIAQVQTYHVVKLHAASTLDLPEAGDSRLHFQHAVAMPEIVGFDFVNHSWTRSNQRHLTLQHVNELRQFIE